MIQKKSKKRKISKDKDLAELQRALKAIKGAGHNPIDWTSIINFVAPIIARLAARYAASYLAGQWNKRATPKIRTDVAVNVADRLSSALQSALK